MRRHTRSSMRLSGLEQDLHDVNLGRRGALAGARDSVRARPAAGLRIRSALAARTGTISAHARLPIEHRDRLRLVAQHRGADRTVPWSYCNSHGFHRPHCDQKW